MTAPPAVPVLVVDDYRDAADSTAAVLAAHGHDARTAYCCTGAVREVEHFRPAVVVLDLRLGDGTGYALAGELVRALGYRPVLVAMTGVGGLDGQSRAAGFDRHLLKPVNPADLLAIIDRAPPVPPASGPDADGGPHAGRADAGVEHSADDGQ